MKRLNTKWLAVLLGLLLCTAGWTYQQRRRVQWEYEVFLVGRQNLTELLNNEGKEGWELIQVNYTEPASIHMDGVYIFKRPK
jgi:hypothetical protein